jgi:hypothetical protein
MRSFTHRVRAVLVAASAAALLAGVAPAQATSTPHDGTQPAATGPRAAAVTLSLRDAVDQIRVADEDRTGYSRDKFGSGWIDADHDGCNTRAEVLLAEAVTPPTVTGRCTLSGGTWYSWYDEETVTATDIDHVVPLAEAWDSGASAWTPERRIAYANNLDDPRHLEAVSQHSNRSKGDKDIAEWLPLPAEQCRYLSYWVPIKLAWDLSADSAEMQAMHTLAAQCPDTEITYTPVP